MNLTPLKMTIFNSRRSQPSLRKRSLIAVALAAVSLYTALWDSPAIALVKSAPRLAKPNTTGVGSIALEKLSPEAKITLKLIQKGGPFPFPQKDGTVFLNFERHLPNAPRGYYREYTVPTPGVRTRGARRIVAGQRKEYYYTSDHYNTFSRIQLSGTIKLKSIVP